MMYMLETEGNRREDEANDVKISWAKEEKNDEHEEVKKKDQSEPTAWQKYLQKRKQKRKVGFAVMCAPSYRCF